MIRHAGPRTPAAAPAAAGGGAAGRHTAALGRLQQALNGQPRVAALAEALSRRDAGAPAATPAAGRPTLQAKGLPLGPGLFPAGRPVQRVIKRPDGQGDYDEAGARQEPWFKAEHEALLLHMLRDGTPWTVEDVQAKLVGGARGDGKAAGNRKRRLSMDAPAAEAPASAPAAAASAAAAAAADETNQAVPAVASDAARGDRKASTDSGQGAPKRLHVDAAPADAAEAKHAAPVPAAAAAAAAAGPRAASAAEVHAAARLHLGAVARHWMRGDAGAMLAGIPGGGAFTSKRGVDGSILVQDTGAAGDRQLALTSAQIATLLAQTRLFNTFVEALQEEVRRAGPPLHFTLYRAMRVQDPGAIDEKSVLRDIIPSSCSFSQAFGAQWAAGAGKVLLNITVPIDYRMVMMSYPALPQPLPDAEARALPVARNQDQQEVVIGPSEYKVTGLTRLGSHVVLDVVPRPLDAKEFETPIEQARAARQAAEAAVRPAAAAAAAGVAARAFAGGQEYDFSDAPDRDGRGVVYDEVFSRAQQNSLKTLAAGAEITDLAGRRWIVVEAWDDMFDNSRLRFVG